MTQLPLIPSHTCNHHSSTSFPPGSEDGVEDTAEQSQYFQDIALWILHQDGRFPDPIAELENPKFRKLVEEISREHRADQRFIRLSDKNLQTGISAGCPCCLWMVDWLPNNNEVGNSSTDCHFAALHCSENKAGVFLPELSTDWFFYTDPADAMHLPYLRLIFATSSVLSWAPSEQRHLMTASASLESVLSRVREWMYTCANVNDGSAPRTAPFIPTRILEISADKNVTKIRLIEPEEPLPSYAALSYCWGMNVQPCWLTGAVLPEYKQGIDFASLPQTIQDAVTVAKGLHILHLWVDALCIIQDDEMDKSHEIGQMGSIYERSNITILASRAASVTEGFLNPNLGYEIEAFPCVLEMGGDFDTERPNGTITTSRSIVLGQNSLDFLLDQGPLTSRGWAYQERFLSHRTIEFTLLEIAWGGEIYTGPATFRERYRRNLPSSLFPYFPPENRPISWDMIWAKLVMEYTQRTLRYSQDRLPALAGIAQCWGDSVDDSYVAGLWRSSLPGALVWHVEDPEPALGINGTLLAPSWSWAAASGPVKLDQSPRDNADHMYAECLEVNTTSQSVDSVFSNVATGVVKLNAVLKPIRLSGSFILYKLMTAYLDDFPHHFPPGARVSVFLDRFIPTEDVPFFMVPICASVYTAGFTDFNYLSALVLVRNLDGSFSRRGVIRIDDDWQPLIEGSKQVIELV